MSRQSTNPTTANSQRVIIHPPTSATAYPVLISRGDRNWSAGAIDFAILTTADTRDNLLRFAGEQIALHLLDQEIAGNTPTSPTSPENLDLVYLEELDDGYEVVYVEPAKLSEFGTAIYRAMAEDGVNEAELARRLGVSHTLANRISDPLYYGHTSNTLRKVAAALGREIVVSLKVD